MRMQPYYGLFMIALLMSPQGICRARAQQGAATAARTPLRADVEIQSTYQLGPGDQIVLQGPEAEEIVNKPFRIDPNGDVSIPMIGRVAAAGLSVRQLEDALKTRLSTLIKDPQIVVNVVEFRSQPVSVLGAVNQSGIQQLQGRKTLSEMISMAGGFRPDAGHTIKISRDAEWGRVPLRNATDDATGKFSTAEISVSDLLEARNPELNILIMPHDTITVPPAKLVYVIGDVKKSGGFILNQREHISVVQALAMAEGLGPTADTRHSRILRRNADETVPPKEIIVDLKGILAGKSEDIGLGGGDILYVPGSTGKKVGLRTAEAILQTASGVAIWH